jgi:hypothetical protein
MAKPIDFKIGDKVAIKSVALKPRRGETFEVVGVSTVYIRNADGRVRSIHVSNLKHASC